MEFLLSLSLLLYIFFGVFSIFNKRLVSFSLYGYSFNTNYLDLFFYLFSTTLIYLSLLSIFDFFIYKISFSRDSSLNETLFFSPPILFLLFLFTERFKKIWSIVVFVFFLMVGWSIAYETNSLPLMEIPENLEIKVSIINKLDTYHPDDEVFLRIFTNAFVPIRGTIVRQINWAPEIEEEDRHMLYWRRENVKYSKFILKPFKENIVSIRLNKALCQNSLIYMLSSGSQRSEFSFESCADRVIHTGDYVLRISASSFLRNNQENKLRDIDVIRIREKSDMDANSASQRKISDAGFYDSLALNAIYKAVRLDLESRKFFENFPVENPILWSEERINFYEDTVICSTFKGKFPLKGYITGCIPLQEENGTHLFYDSNNVIISNDTIEEYSESLSLEKRTKLAQEALMDYMKWRKDNNESLLMFDFTPLEENPKVERNNETLSQSFVFSRLGQPGVYRFETIAVMVDYQANICIFDPYVRRIERHEECLFKNYE